MFPLQDVSFLRLFPQVPRGRPRLLVLLELLLPGGNPCGGAETSDMDVKRPWWRWRRAQAGRAPGALRGPDGALGGRRGCAWPCAGVRVALCAAAGAGRCLEAGQGGNLSWEELKTAAWVSGVCVRVRVCVFPVTLVWVMSKENHREDCKSRAAASPTGRPQFRGLWQRHVTPGAETKDRRLLTAVGARRVSAFSPVPEPVSCVATRAGVQGCTGAVREGPELREAERGRRCSGSRGRGVLGGAGRKKRRRRGVSRNDPRPAAREAGSGRVASGSSL